MSDPRESLIVALDVSTGGEARKLVSAVGDAAGFFKIGKQLFTAEGPALVREFSASGRRIFLDLKFHDIPNTIGAAVKSAAALNIAMLTVHAAGGSRMLRAALDAARAAKTPPMVLAVTVLTSFNDQDLQESVPGARVRDQVLRLAALARNCGCDGIVTSPNEAASVRQELGAGFAIVTPGVRPAGSAQDDQARVATPARAISAGATHIVVGRPIAHAPDPGAAARAIVEEIASVSVAGAVH